SLTLELNTSILICLLMTLLSVWVILLISMFITLTLLIICGMMVPLQQVGSLIHLVNSWFMLLILFVKLLILLTLLLAKSLLFLLEMIPLFVTNSLLILMLVRILNLTFGVPVKILTASMLIL